MKLISTACPRNCYSTCSFKVSVDKGKIINFEPHPDNLATPEGMCLKGLSYKERVYSKARLGIDMLSQRDSEPILDIHPEEAQKRNIKNGEVVRVFNSRGELKIKVLYQLGVRRRCVFTANG